MGAEEEPQVVRSELPGSANPAAVLARLAGRPHPFALTGSWAGCDAVVGSSPVTVSTAPAGLDQIFGAGGPAAAGTFGSVPGPARPRFGGGWIGYLGYGLAGRLHALPPAAGGPRLLPDCWFGYYDHVLVLDGGRWYFEALMTPGRQAELDASRRELAALLTAEAAAPPRSARYRLGEFEVAPSPEAHQEAVASAVGLIRAGDMFQANITLRLEAAFAGDPLDLFGRGASVLNPPYAAFLRVDDERAVASFSPELFLRRTGREVAASPIKGTGPRSDDPGLAAQQRADLARSAKNRAENVMIVDLMRSDLSGVCRPGTVTVPRLAGTEAHPGLWHLVSDVRGELADGRTDAELIRATFPPGSVTGAPKVRAMEVISALEAAPREVYTGAIGYCSPVAGLELNVAIRTFEFAAGRVWLGAGGGIVAGSQPAAEYAECLVKSGPLIAAVGGRFGSAGGPLASPQAALRALAPRPAAGIFTSLPVVGGLADGLGEHLARLAASVREVFGKDLPPELPALAGKCLAGGGTGRLRITVRPLGGPLHCEVEMMPGGPEAGAIRLRRVEVASWPGGHQWADRRLLAYLSAQAGLVAGEQLLLTSPAGHVLETDRANVFAVVDGVLRTPAANGTILPGIMRARVLAAAAAAGLAVAQGPLPLSDLDRASEIFVTNSVRGVAAVLSREGDRPGPVTARLAAAVSTGSDDRRQEPERSLPGSRRRGRAGAAGGGAGLAVLVIDNYDSFTFNLVHQLQVAGATVEVVRNDEVTAAQAAGFGASAVVLSPGPCAPADAGLCVDLVRALGGRTPVLGVCLGHQAIAVAYGGQVGRVEPVHGQASVIEHDGRGIFGGLPPRFEAARYHSLLVAAATLPPALEVSARTGPLAMAIRHRQHPVDGVQFHPESILTGSGALLIENFLRSARVTRPG
jgi:para-aminobenzoate synthetase/4-amino-4-deoxychorismate lyase